MTLPSRHRIRIRALAVWGLARYPSVTEAPHNINLCESAGKEHFVSLKLEGESGIWTRDLWLYAGRSYYCTRAPALSDRDFYREIMFYILSNEYLNSEKNVQYKYNVTQTYGATIRSPGEGEGAGVFVADNFFILARLGCALKISYFITCLIKQFLK